MNFRVMSESIGSEPVIVSSSAGEALHALVEGRGLISIVPGYESPEFSELIARRIEDHKDLSSYAKAKIEILGCPYYNTVGDEIAEAEYWDKAPGWNSKVRDIFKPWGSPFDRIRCELDQYWPYGVRLLRDAQLRAAFAGLPRVFRSGSPALPHADRLEWDAPVARFPWTPKAQIAVNLYLRVPPVGGEVALWRFKPDKEAYDQNRYMDYAYDPDALDPPEIEFAPMVGDLAFFDAQKIHSVLPGIEGSRVALSFFLVQAPWGEFFVYS